ncbi:hypothetical protein PVK06_014585 [Gossypium arboreum]|uniref:Uncharacterized protein n=1 Tax=Gossypium arboreum TaxID=29729 RepID=A0ABR0PUY1_GOSAR|nr:hypothetical protein PVK06_014585 [Gossypium arboreum]
MVHKFSKRDEVRKVRANSTAPASCQSNHPQRLPPRRFQGYQQPRTNSAVDGRGHGHYNLSNQRSNWQVNNVHGPTRTHPQL